VLIIRLQINFVAGSSSKVFLSIWEIRSIFICPASGLLIPFIYETDYGHGHAIFF
jgi:hypothetical protein